MEEKSIYKNQSYKMVIHKISTNLKYNISGQSWDLNGSSQNCLYNNNPMDFNIY